MAFEAVIFDIGEVLEETPATVWERRWATRLGMEPPEMDRRLESIWRAGELGSLTLSEVERQTARALDLDQAALERFMADVWAEYLGTLNQALARYFAALRPRFRTGILSNSFVGAREREQEVYGFADMCDVLVYSHQEAVKKPDATSYEIACERLCVRPSRAIFLDNVVACVEGARRVGMTAVAFIDTEQAIAELNQHLSA